MGDDQGGDRLAGPRVADGAGGFGWKDVVADADAHLVSRTMTASGVSMSDALRTLLKETSHQRINRFYCDRFGSSGDNVATTFSKLADGLNVGPVDNAWGSKEKLMDAAGARQLPGAAEAIADSPPRVGFRWLGGLVQAVGLFIVLIGYGLAAFELNGYLATVFPTVRGHGLTIPGHPVDRTWVVMVAVMSFGLLACAGMSVRPPRTRWPRGAITQGLAGVLVLGVTALGHEFYFIDPTEGDYCFYDSCWPMHEQTLALAAPAVAAGLALLIFAFLARWVRWWLRAVVPAIVWVAAMLVQQAVWSTWLLPIFEGPPV